MFTKILIANRGEIACRVMETARAMGVKTVAVYSDVDVSARHVGLADQAVHIGGSAPADSYLRGDVIIQAALDTGAQAINPGYGFLSENPEFVDAVTASGLVFIGPSAQAIRAMGLKDAAKVLMEKAGVPVVPGYHGANQGATFLAQAAEKIGFPVLIKAVAGGGGKGMRMVEQAGDFATHLASARSEALKSFANDAVLIEKYIQNPRHIEVQVFGDGTNVVHLFERDCSLQRRHQKVIEEAPAPGMTDAMRAAMCDAAVKAAKAINYAGAGTVEFIVDTSDGLNPDGFWFMEMNTRLQVEHPVTEAVTGIDLVEWQLRVAAGEALPKQQAEIALNGHAFEARLYAENVPAGFLPATGTLRHLQFPTGVRVDTGVRAGDEISPFYDPMIAKVTSHGATRDIALLQLSAALGATEIAGTVTNLSFLTSLASHADFVDGHVDTGLIGRHLDQLTAEQPAPRAAKALAAICAAGLGKGGAVGAGFTLWSPLRCSVRLGHGSDCFTAILQVQSPDAVLVCIDGDTVQMLQRDGQWGDLAGCEPLRYALFGDSVSVFGVQSWHFDIPDPLAVESETAQGGNTVQAPMPGLVKVVLAKVGQQVNTGDPLVVLEAMKMEHSLVAPRDGVIAEVLVSVDDQVQSGSDLLSLREQDT
ncbi:MAG: acetyl/propionyl/methylcrotonyl-CoA carboxylase subunit alpha [Paracoccaceae bacterium]